MPLCQPYRYPSPMTPPVFVADVGNALLKMAAECNATHLFMLTDSNTLRCCMPTLQLQHGEKEVTLLSIEAGEHNKGLSTAVTLWQQLIAHGATRSSMLVNLGGGVVCDMGGFVATTFKRGMPFVNIPTTLLAMVDAATGGKNGINFEGLKNEIGTFANARATLLHTRWLTTLSDEEMLSGYGEMLKHALLADERHWADVLLMDATTAKHHAAYMEPVIARSLQVKTDIVAQDPHEKGLRKVLNLGHTTAHALESLLMQRPTSSFLLPHGHAVAHGLVAALYMSCVLCGFPIDKMRKTVAHIRQCYGRPPITCDDYDALFDIIQHDKKNWNNQPAFVLLEDIGSARTDVAVDKQLFCEALDFVREG